MHFPETMLLLLFLLASSECGGAPYRRSPMEALERLRSARYLPQVDYSEDEYQLYALPPQWTSDEYEYYRQEDPEELGYNELMRSYLMEQQQQQQQQVQRRSDVTPPTTSSTPQVNEKSVESMVVADPPDAPAGVKGAGQKEEPLFRPQQTSQRTTAWNKTPIPLLKQMVIGGQKKKDVLLEELNSLKKH